MKDRIYHCPTEVAVDVIGGKWTPVVLAHVKDGPVRYSQLRRLIPDITEKMLAQRLRELENEGIIHRDVVGHTPPHVEYALTPAGRSLQPVLQALYDWGDLWASERSLTVMPVLGTTPQGNR